MSTRLYKEARELLPLWVGAALLVTFPYLVWGEEAGFFAWPGFAIGCLIMAAHAFGSEFQQQTMVLLLSQPVARRVIWREKMLVLAMGIVLSFALAWDCLEKFTAFRPVDHGGMLVLIGLLTIGSTPFWTLLSRSGIAGIVFSVLAVGLVLLGSDFLGFDWIVNRIVTEDYPPRTYWAIGVVALLCAYAGISCWLGYRRFLCLQAVDSRPAALGLPRWLEDGAWARLPWLRAGRVGPFAALLRKEARLHGITFALAGGLALWVTLAVGVTLLSGKGVSSVWADAGLIILMFTVPFVAGTVAVSDERGMGVAEWQLTLPIAGWKQWSAKMLVALMSSLTLGFLLPVGMLMVMHGFGARGGLEPAWELCMVALMQLYVTTLAAYAGSFCRNTVKAVLVGVALALAGYLCVALTFNGIQEWFRWYLSAYHTVPKPPELLLTCLGVFVVTLLIQRFAYTNFRRIRWSAGTIAGQVLVVLVLITLFSALIITWQLLAR